MIEFIRSLDASIELKVADPWMWEKEALPAEEDYIQRAVEKRKSEFRAGRHSARAVLDQLGIRDFPLRVGNQRQPLWPDGVIGSISHTEGMCACVGLREGKYSAIGIDIEKREPVDKSSLPLICSRKELGIIKELEAQNDNQIPLCKLIFSAKECVHKVYHPLNGHTLDFLDAEIELDLENQTFIAYITNPEKNPKTPIKSLKGAYDFSENYLFTAILKEQA